MLKKFFAAVSIISLFAPMATYADHNTAHTISQLQAQIAALLGVLDIPAHGEKTVAIILGQTDRRKHAIELVQKYKNLEIRSKCRGFF